MDDPKTQKKRRRDRRLAQPRRMRLTERDRDIIEAVHLYRLLRQDQIQALFFGTQERRAAGADASLRSRLLGAQVSARPLRKKSDTLCAR